MKLKTQKEIIVNLAENAQNI